MPSSILSFCLFGVPGCAALPRERRRAGLPQSGAGPDRQPERDPGPAGIPRNPALEPLSFYPRLCAPSKGDGRSGNSGYSVKG
jgi:hypothetical protein